MCCYIPPFYLLVMTYALIQLFLYMLEEFFRNMCLFLWIFMMCLLLTLQPWCGMCPSDIQQRQSELLQLTAGYTYQRSVQAWEAKECTYSEPRCNSLREREVSSILMSRNYVYIKSHRKKQILSYYDHLSNLLQAFLYTMVFKIKKSEKG
jgi:hypothetical protein